MTPENFCYWLKGIFEIQEAGLDKNAKASIKLTESQIDMINQHLGYVFAPQVKTTKPDYSTAGSAALVGGPRNLIGGIC